MSVISESICFHPDNAWVVRVLGVIVVVAGLAGLAWLLRGLAGGGSPGPRQTVLAVGWLVVCVAVFFLVTRTGVRLTLDLDRKMVRQDARIGGVPQIQEFPFGAFQHVTVSFDHAEWETWGSTRSQGSGRSTKHVSPVLAFKLALDGVEEVRIESFHVVRAAERRAVELARLLGLPAERRGYAVGAMTAEELRSFRVVRSQFVGPGEELGSTEGLAVGTLRIRAVKGASQPLSLDAWPKDETRTIPVIVPKTG